MRQVHRLSRSPAYFERLYAMKADPWDFETCPYEHAKYSSTLAALGDRKFINAFEAGCSIGVLTEMLARSCKSLLASDVVEDAIKIAAARCASLTNVRFEKHRIPQNWPSGQIFDLILFSEVLYFLNPRDIQETARLASHSLTPEGLIVLVNYTESVPEPCDGNEAADIFLNTGGIEVKPVRRDVHQKFRIDILAKAH